MSGRRLLPGGRLDRYVAALFTGAYGTAFLLVVGLFLVLDLAANLDDYLRPGPDGSSPPGIDIAFYYALHLPFLYLQVAPYVTLVAGLFAGSRMLRDNEIVAALGAGVSSQRLFLPMIVLAGVLAGGMFALREAATEGLWLRRELARYGLENRARDGSPPVLEDVWMKDSAGEPVHLGKLHLLDPYLNQVMVDDLSALAHQRDRWVSLRAERATWIGGSPGTWKLEHGTREVLDPLEQRVEPIETLDQVRFEPVEAVLAHKGRATPLDLSFAEARALAARDPDNAQYRSLLHHQLTFPLANLVLLLVGLPFLVQGERRRGVEGVAAGFVLCLFYFALDFASRALGLEGQISPLLAAWWPVLFCGSLGAVLYGTMRS